MKKQFILLFISLLTFNAFAQIEFKKGYYIDNNDQKIECLINNTNWLISSTEFQFKTNENSEVKIISIDQVAEYGINEESRFIRANVSIDNSSDNLSELSNEKNPLFEEKELFLKVLVQGKANLYLYQQKNATRFFYNIDTNKIEQLIFKRYKVNGNQISKNNFYKQQLWNTVKCENTMMKEVENVAYNENALAKFFIKYNACKNSVSTTFKARDSKGLFHFTIRPGINISSFGLDYGNVYTNQFFEKRSEVGYRFGIEAESILPFNKNKWSLLVEPSYQQFTNTKVVYDQDIRIDYKAIEIPLGLRYSVFLKKIDSKLFINALLVINFTPNSILDFENGTDIEIDGGSYLAAGFGYKYKDIYSAEIRFDFNREILNRNSVWQSTYHTISFVLGYRIF